MTKKADKTYPGERMLRRQRPVQAVSWGLQMERTGTVSKSGGRNTQ